VFLPLKVVPSLLLLPRRLLCPVQGFHVEQRLLLLKALKVILPWCPVQGLYVDQNRLLLLLGVFLPLKVVPSLLL
jgi:hypothetical protein